jgi:hypothetical protein
MTMWNEHDEHIRADLAALAILYDEECAAHHRVRARLREREELLQSVARALRGIALGAFPVADISTMADRVERLLGTLPDDEG